MIDHCVAFLRRKNEKQLYEMYVTEALKLISENTAKACIGGGSSIKIRYADLIFPKDPEEDKTAEQIIAGIKNKANKIREG